MDYAPLWEGHRELEEFKKEYGHCNVPFYYTENPKLGRWVGTQRQNMKKDKFSRDKITLLEGIGFYWDRKKTFNVRFNNNFYEEKWLVYFAELKKFIKKNGHCNVTRRYHENQRFGSWCGRQRERYRKGKLPDDKIKVILWRVIFTPLREACDFPSDKEAVYHRILKQ